MTAVRKELDDLIRSLDKSYGEASLISPAFQWAQNSSHIFLQVKYAQRWNAPGALEVHNASISVSDCCFSFKGFGEHSMIRKEYKLFLHFFDPVLEKGSSWHFAAAGRLVVTIKKKWRRKWMRLLRSENVQPANMGVWQDMQAKWKSELAKRKKDKMYEDDKDDDDDDDDEGDEDEDDEDTICEQSTFQGSGVVELCPEYFLKGPPTTWSVLFYSPNAKMSAGLGHLWRALADMVGSKENPVAIGAVDCSRYSTFCEEKGAKQRKLPIMMRYRPGSKNPRIFSGEHVLEDLVAWASGHRKEL